MKKIDALSKKYLEIIYKKGYRKIPNLSINEARKMLGSDSSTIKADQKILIDFDDQKIPLHIYHPVSKKSDAIILYLHGGGYVIRQLAQCDRICRKLADDNNACIILVEYCLAPENKFPQAIEETSFAIDWVANNKTILACDSDTTIYLYGESSGANLTVASQLYRRNIQVNGLILMCPSLDYTHQYPSKTEYANGFLLDHEIRLWFACQYLNNENERKKPLVTFILADNLHVLPKTLIIRAYFDPLRDEANAFHEKLLENDVSAELKQFDCIHGFLNLNIEPFSESAFKIIQKFL